MTQSLHRTASIFAALACGALVGQDTRVPSRLALLVGVGAYGDGTGFRPLRGAGHDVAAMGAVLTERFGFTAGDVLTLVDGAATLEGFLSAFDRHLLQRAGEDTQVVVYFACHGSMIPDRSGVEQNVKGRPHDSSLVLFDSRTATRRGAFDLSDDVLAALLGALADKGAQVTLLTDACHSGGVLRSGRSGEARFAEFGTQAVEDPTAWPGWPAGVAFEDDRAGSDSNPRLVHLAACSARQAAYEYDFDTMDGARPHGVFTFCLVESLRRVQPGETFALLARRVELAMHQLPETPLQNPWLLGPATRQVLAGGFGGVPAGFPLRASSEGVLTLEAGYLHGLVAGAELDVHALGSGAAPGGTVLGRVHITRLGYGSSLVVWTTKPEREIARVPMQAFLAALPDTLPRLAVFVADPALAQRLRASRWADVQSERPDLGDYVVESKPTITLRTREGIVLWPKAGATVVGVDPDAALEAAFGAEQHFQSLWRLATASLVGDLSQLKLAWRAPDAADLASRDGDAVPAWQAAPVEKVGDREWRVTLPDYDHQERERVGALAMLDIHNESRHRVHLTVLNLNEARGIREVKISTPDRPAGATGRAAERREWLGAHSRAEWPLARPMRDRYVVIATDKPISFAGVTRGDAPVSPAGWGIAYADLWVQRAPTLNMGELQRMVEQAEKLVADRDLEGARVVTAATWDLARGFAERHYAPLQARLWSLGLAAYAAYDIETAHDAWLAVVGYREATLPPDHLDLLGARSNLAIAKKMLGDLRGAEVLEERVMAVLTAKLPDDHAQLQAVRGNLGLTKKRLGDLAGALALLEKVHAVQAAKLADDHPELQTARQNLAIVKLELGDHAGALELQSRVVEVLGRLLPADHPRLQSARGDLAAVLMRLGDPVAALALQEQVYAVRTRLLPDGHPELWSTWTNLAAIRRELGDSAGAIALLRRVLASCERALPEGSPEIDKARLGLGGALASVGELEEGRRLEEQVVADLRSRPRDDGMLPNACGNLALTLLRAGDVTCARALLESALELLLTRSPEDHPDVQTARGVLVRATWTSGRIDEARALQERVLVGHARQLAPDNPRRTDAMASCAWLRLLTGDTKGAVTMATEWSATIRRHAVGWALAPRMAGLRADDERPLVDLLLSMATGYAGGDASDDLVREALMVSGTLQHLDTRVARRMRRARMVDAGRASELQQHLTRAGMELADLAQRALPTDAAAMATHAATLAEAVLRKESAQRELSALAARAGDVDAPRLEPQDLVARLPARSLAAALVRYERHRPAPDDPGKTFSVPCLAALVVSRAGLRLVQLGEYEAVEKLVVALRAEAGASELRGREAGATPPSRTSQALRRAVLDPVLAVDGEIDTLYLAVDEVLELVPLDALLHEDGTPVGVRLGLRHLASIFDLCETPRTVIGDEPRLLTMGDLDYDRTADAPLAVLGDAAAPPVAGLRDGAPRSFRPLLQSKTEIDTVRHFFTDAFPGGRAQAMVKTDASKASLLAEAGAASFLHFATHGYFASESIGSTRDQVDPTPLPVRQRQGATGLSPLVLCGLALSGANLPPDEAGRSPGILTAEEILSLDLSGCFLATLSACDTSLGVRRAGQGYASLRAALLGAGARHVLTSLWKVADQATMELMIDFYRRLWVLKQDPHRALWDAKMEARRRGVPFRDWAGWVLSGR